MQDLNGNGMTFRDLRQIPDTQEVLLYPDAGKSLILEVLQRVEPSDYENAVR